MSVININLYEALRYLAAGGDPAVDGCVLDQFQHMPAEVVETLESYQDVWSEHSGIQNYPVPHPRLEAEEAYKTVNKWVGPYGDSRRRMAGYLAAVVGGDYIVPVTTLSSAHVDWLKSFEV